MKQEQFVAAQKHIDAKINELRQEFFKVNSIAQGYVVVSFLSEDLKKIGLEVLDKFFEKVHLEHLPPDVLLDYAHILNQVEEFNNGGAEFSLNDSPKKREQLLKYLRDHRKDVDSFAMVDKEGQRL